MFAVLKDGRLVTPALSGTILPGITRDSLLTIAREDMKLVSRSARSRSPRSSTRPTSSSCAARPSSSGPVASINDRGTVHKLPKVPGPVALELSRRLVEIQEGRAPDRRGWLRRVG